MSNDFFEMVVHHVTILLNNGSLEYIRDISMWSCDLDRWSYFEVVDIVKQIGYVAIKELWYVIGLGSLLGKRFHLLCNDTGAMDIVHIGKQWGQVHLFVIHTISTAKIVEMLEYPVEDNIQENYEGEGQGGGGVDGEVEGEVQGKVEVGVAAKVQGEVEGEF